MIKRNSFGPKYVSVHPDNIAAEANVAGEQFLLEEQTLNVESSLIYRIPVVSKRGQFRAKVNLNKEHCIEVIPPLNVRRAILTAV
jgi:hypothetical protein